MTTDFAKQILKEIREHRFFHEYKEAEALIKRHKFEDRRHHIIVPLGNTNLVYHKPTQRLFKRIYLNDLL